MQDYMPCTTSNNPQIYPESPVQTAGIDLPGVWYFGPGNKSVTLLLGTWYTDIALECNNRGFVQQDDEG
jgi:hypothetical protein